MAYKMQATMDLAGGNHPVMPEDHAATKVCPDRLSNTQREAHHYNNSSLKPLGTI